MKKIRILSVLILCLFLVSCAGIQAISNEDLKNAESSRIIAKNLLSTWKLNSGFIRGALGSNISQLPAQAVDAMNELDKLAEKINLNDFDLGYSLGLRIRALSSIVQEAFRMYAPEILKYLPSLLKL